MTTTTSYSKQKSSRFLHIYKTTLRQQRGLLLFYSLFLLIFVVFPNFAESYQLQQLSANLTHYSSRPSHLSALILGGLAIAMPLLLAVILFSYLLNRRAVDFYHSLPVARETMLYAQCAVGATILTVPVLAAQLLSALSFVIFPLPDNQSRALIGTLAWSTLLILGLTLILFVITVFVAVNCSTVIELLGYSAALSIFGFALVMIWITLSSFSLYGYSTFSSSHTLRYLSPLGLLANLYTIDAGSLLSPLVWAGIAAVLFFCTVRCYHARASEWAEEKGRTSPLSIFVRVFAAAVWAFFLTAMLKNFFSSSPWVYLLGALLGAPLGYCIVEVIASNGFTTLKKSWPLIGFSTSLMLGLSFYFVAGGFGFETWVPESSQITSVTLEQSNILRPSSGQYNEKFLRNAPSAQEALPTTFRAPTTFTDPELIEQIRNLHQTAVDQQERSDPDSLFRASIVDYITFSYNTKPFGEKERTYSLFYESLPALLSIRNNREFLEKTHAVFGIIPEHIQGLQITDKLGISLYDESLSLEQLGQLLEAMRTDLRELGTKPPDFSPSPDYATLSLNLRDPFAVRDEGIEPLLLYNNCRMNLLPSSTNTLALLKEWKLFQPTSDYSAVKELQISMANDLKLSSFANATANENTLSYLSTTIADPALIQTILEHASLVPQDSLTSNIVYVSKPTQLQHQILYISNETALELLSGTDKKIAYLLSIDELTTLAPALVQNREKEEQQTATSDATLTTSEYSAASEPAVPVTFMTQEYTMSVGEYFAAHAPEFLQNRSPAVTKALYETPFTNESGYSLFYQVYHSFF